MQVNFRGNINSTYQNKNNNNNKIKNAAITAAQWFGFGIGLDIVNYKFTAIKSPAKKSLFINTPDIYTLFVAFLVSFYFL